jgi:hypothetical protein
MSLTKEYLNKLYVDEKENIKKNRIQKIVTHMMDLAIKNAKKGELFCKENFPHEINEIKEDILQQLKFVFPDSKIIINENEYLEHFPRSQTITINWD